MDGLIGIWRRRKNTHTHTTEEKGRGGVDLGWGERRVQRRGRGWGVGGALAWFLDLRERRVDR